MESRGYRPEMFNILAMHNQENSCPIVGMTSLLELCSGKYKTSATQHTSIEHVLPETDLQTFIYV